MAMKLRGWCRVAARGRDWLCKVQDQDGFWQEAAADPVHLTVLVLDALALVAGDFRLTFGRQPKARVNEKTHDVGPLDTAEQRLAAINNYIREVGEKTGKKITKKQIWSEELYKSPTEFERWQRADPKATKKATDVFNGILAEKPHLK
jgi:hypothetical protein